MDLHYGRDDFTSQDKLINVLSRDRSKDMASDYEPARDYAERRGITFRERVERVVEIVRQVPEKVDFIIEFKAPFGLNLDLASIRSGIWPISPFIVMQIWKEAAARCS